MATNHNYYDIEIADIWQYEQNEFLSDKSLDDLAKKIINKTEEVIIKEGEESFTVDLDDGKSRAYYERNLNEYRESSNTLKGRYNNNFFFNNQVCYQYDQSIIVTQESPDFDFWFALKLRQYDSKLTEVKNFLEYQLERAFNKDLVRFIDFLKLEMKQFSDTIFDDRITESIGGWIKDKNSLNRKLKGKYSSLRLRELNTNPDYLKKNSHVLNDVLKQLKANNFIHEDTLFTNFNRIFEGNIIPKSKRIVWTGKNKELHWFMNYLVKDTKKVELHKNDIWLVANKCFVDKEGKEFGIDPLRKANGDNMEQKKLLESILAKI
ncbi:hypothetical protein [Winogradskyella luteola]|uniref:Uncharacterized protein n=1 Tax=Winogradskyella luteola TaxID=2828330 RepID=A0A9X1FB32_9FLAO|nr:hypothetical protein [Winogradskyella luteola]MBV7270567.1 hypothetical protein [Winogradskyella luteola]